MSFKLHSIIGLQFEVLWWGRKNKCVGEDEGECACTIEHLL